MIENISVELIGVCHGITADGWVSADEIYFLATWLNEHPQALKVWPGSEFVEPLNRFFKDGSMDARELEEVIALLARIEREWTARRAGSGSVREPATATTKKGRPRKTAGPPPIPQLFDWRRIALPSANWQGEVTSFSGSGSYLVDLREPYCNCPDWLGRRAALPASHPAKACKHIVSVLCNQSGDGAITLPPLLQFILFNANSHGIGVFPADNYGCFEIKGSKILFSYGTPPWMNVWAPDGEEYGRYGYNTDEERWSYGEKPKNAGLILGVITSFRLAP